MPTTRKSATPKALSRGTKLTLGFGLVNVDVKIAPLVKSDAGRVKGRMLCATHGAPVKYEKVCTEGGEPCETVTGYEHDGTFVLPDTDALGMERDGRLELVAAVDVASIDPVYFSKPYLLEAQEGHSTGLDLLAAVMRTSGKALVGTTVLNKATKAVVVRWSELLGSLIAHQCEYDANFAWGDVEKLRTFAAERDEPSEQHIAAAEQLLTAIEKDGFAFGDVVDEYDQQLREAIELAADGKPIPQRESATPAAPVVDLMAALEASVAAAKPKKVAA